MVFGHPLDISQGDLAASGRKRGRPRAVDKEPIRESVHEPVRSATAVAHGRRRKRKGNVDQFYVPAEVIPAGWTYQWCRKEVFGQADTSHMIGLLENGWTTVPAERHEGMFMPPGYRGEIIRGGLVLMERPTELTDEARAEDKANADNLLRMQQEQLGLAMPQSFTTNHPGVRPNIRTSYERGMPQGKQPLAID